MSIRALALSLLIFLLDGSALGAGPDVAVAVREAGDGFIVEAAIETPVAPQTAWAVLIDYDHMTAILSNLTTSKVASRSGNLLLVRQEGVARFGLFSYPFQVEREIRLEPMTRIRAKNLSGSMKRMESEVRLSAMNDGSSVHIDYHARFEFDSILAGLFAVSFLRHEVEEQFRLMIAEMQRRDAQSRSAVLPNDR